MHTDDIPPHAHTVQFVTPTADIRRLLPCAVMCNAARIVLMLHIEQQQQQLQQQEQQIRTCTPKQERRRRRRRDKENKRNKGQWTGPLDDGRPSIDHC